MRCAAGISAVEFTLLAPVLVVGAFSTADAGMAIYEKMMIGQALRAGAQLAMAGAEKDDVLDVLRQVASENFTLAGSAEAAPGGAASGGMAAESKSLAVSVSRYCACPGTTFVQVGCGGICDTGLPARFYRLTATKTFDGVILPAFSLDGTIDVMAE